jgi:UPF0176 protein
MCSSHKIIAYYFLTSIEDPHAEVALHKAFFQNKDIKSRIYISEEGINCQMSADIDSADGYIAWMQSRPQFREIFFKIDAYHEHVFPKQTIKYRRQLVAFDAKVDYARSGKHVSPQEWADMLSNNESVIVDVRNDYEWKIGHFAGAECPPCQKSKDFIAYAEELKTRVDPQKTPIMMYCTGGIRCETFSALLKEGGFENVYQLDGGVINYGHELGSKHWQGKLFVFDDRMAVPLSETETDATPCATSLCDLCLNPCDVYYNCANVQCNRLFLCCSTCLEQFQGCCHATCTTGEKVRPYHKHTAHKPFRKWYHYWADKTKSQKTEKA